MEPQRRPTERFRVGILPVLVLDFAGGFEDENQDEDELKLSVPDEPK